MKCKRAETAKKYGPEHCISLKTGLKQPKMAKNDQTASKFKNLVYFPKKIPIIDPVYSSMVFRIGSSQKQLVAAIRDLLETQNGPKQPKMTNFSLYAKLMKNNKIFPFKPSNIQECR